MFLLRLWFATVISFAIFCRVYGQPPRVFYSPGAFWPKSTNTSQHHMISDSLSTSLLELKWMKSISNVGLPYGSNIIEVSRDVANQYKYVAQFEGPLEGEDWTVVIWNTIGPDGSPDGWYGKACREFTLAPGQRRYIAFDENSLGGWAIAPGPSIPIDSDGGYASTWGDFAFGSNLRRGWSSFDVSTTAAQTAGFEIQGMKICDVITEICSFVTRKGGLLHNAYTRETAGEMNIGGQLAPGPARLSVTVDYDA